MEKKHLSRLKQKFGSMLNHKAIWNLDIPDDYGYMDEELIEILKARVSVYIEAPK